MLLGTFRWTEDQMSNFSTIVDSNIKYSRGCLGGTQCRSTINPVSMGLYFEVWTSTGRHIQQDEWFLSQMSIQYLCNVSTGCYKFLRVDKALADGAYISPLLREVDVMISRPSFSSRIHLRATSHHKPQTLIWMKSVLFVNQFITVPIWMLSNFSTCFFDRRIEYSWWRSINGFSVVEIVNVFVMIDSFNQLWMIFAWPVGIGWW